MPKENKENNELINFVKKEIENNQNKERIRCMKLSSICEKQLGKKVSKSTIHNILRKKLNFRYLKTTYKTKKIEFDNNKLYSFFFIKVLAKSIKFNFEFIFIDESKIEIQNNHFRCWRHYDEQALFGINNNAKKNLILGKTKSDVIYYDITDENTNSSTFLLFLEKLKLKINDKKGKKNILMIDNCKAHKTQNLIEFFKKNKINFLFTQPYRSTFTPIELAFRSLKRLTYSRLYNDINEVIKDIKMFKKMKIKKLI